MAKEPTLQTEFNSLEIKFESFKIEVSTISRIITRLIRSKNLEALKFLRFRREW